MKENKKQYILFAKSEFELPILSQPWYLDAVCGKKNWDVIIIKKGNKIVATMPFYSFGNFMLRLIRMPHLTKYLGPYFINAYDNNKHRNSLMRELIKQLPPFNFFEQNFHPSINDYLPFYWKGFTGTTRYTFKIDLSEDIQQIFNNISPNYRNNKISSANKIISVSFNRTLHEFYKIQQLTFHRQKTSLPFSFEFLEKYDCILKEHDSRMIFFAVDTKNQIHSVLYLIWDSNTAYLLMAGDDPQKRKSGAGILLVWEAIKYAKEVLKKKRFDFVGSMLEPITNIRQDFGAELVPYLRIQKMYPTWLKIAREAKDII